MAKNKWSEVLSGLWMVTIFLGGRYLLMVHLCVFLGLMMGDPG